MSEAQRRFLLAMDHYHKRVGLYRKVNELPPDKLDRLARAVAKLTTSDLDAMLAYAEGLAMWSDTEQESVDGEAQLAG